MDIKEDVILKSFLTTNINILTNVATSTMIVLYKDTKDYGKQYVARLWKLENRNMKRYNPLLEQLRFIPTEYVVTADSLQEIRNKVPFYYSWINRYQEDDPCIVGVYI
jgi:hypothetical protein